MATLHAIGKRTGLPRPDFKGNKFDTYVWHGDKGKDWVLFSVTTIDKAGAEAIAKCDPANIIPIGLKSEEDTVITAEAVTSLNAWLTKEKLPVLTADKKVNETLRSFKAIMGTADWEKELAYELPQDPETKAEVVGEVDEVITK